MSGEGKESPDTKESVTTDVVTDELETAADALLGKEITKEGRVEAKPKTEEETDEHKERSQLGRKVKKIEDTLTDLSQKLDTYFSNLNRPVVSEKGNELPEYISTPDDLDKHLDARERKRREATGKYEGAYGVEMRKIGGKDSEEVSSEVLKEVFTLDSPFNRYITGNPATDARINYAEAKAAIVSKKIAVSKPKPNVKGEKPPGSTNLNVSTGEPESSVGEIQLDDFAQSFVTSTKMKDESVRSALGKK